MAIYYNEKLTADLYYDEKKASNVYYNENLVYSGSTPGPDVYTYDIDTGISCCPEPYDDRGYNTTNQTGPELVVEERIYVPKFGDFMLHFDLDQASCNSYGTLEVQVNGWPEWTNSYRTTTPMELNKDYYGYTDYLRSDERGYYIPCKFTAKSDSGYRFYQSRLKLKVTSKNR